MPSMDYFRRPQIAGKNISKTTNAVLRGSVRRANADGVSAVPYFSAAAAAQTLNVTIDGSPFVVTLTGNGINTVISDINTAIGSAGSAFDADGVIAIRSTTSGTLSSVEVTGGTASTALGFNVTLGALRATGGDIPSSPEARLGNPFGVAFPNPSENLNTETLNRALARVSANTDVLFADDMKDFVVLKPVSFTTSDRRLLTLTASQRVFIGGPAFFSGANPTKEELARFFQIIDSSGQLAQSRVVGVVRGSPAGLPPFAAATAWSGGGSAGSVLNTTIDKVTSAVITSIENGRVVQCSAANFSDVVPGDFAEITGATNTSPTSNNGDKWIVEQVISNTTLVLRPMTAAQVTAVGATPTTEVQPLVELNSTKSPVESWGNITVYSGLFSSQVQLVVNPPLPVNGTYTAVCAVPKSLRDLQPADFASSVSTLTSGLVSDEDLVENWTISGLLASPSGADVAVTEGKIRWNGKVFTLPARTFTPGAFTNNARNYLYWDEATANYAISTSVSAFANVLDSVATTNKGHQIAVVDLSGGAITNVIPNIRMRAEKAIPLTVGEGGQFANLPAVASFISNISANYAGETTTLSGSFPHFEVIIVSNTWAGSTPVARFTTVGLTIRGINEKVSIDLGTLVTGLEFNVKFLEIRDLRLGAPIGLSSFINSSGLGNTVDRIKLKNLIQTTGSFETVVAHDVFEAPVSELIVEDCSFITRGLSSCTGGAGTGIPTVRVENSTFSYAGAGAAAPRFVYSALGPNNWNGSTFYMSNCRFLSSWGGSTAWTGGHSFLIASNVSSNIVIRDVTWANGSTPSTNVCYLVNAPSARTLVSNFTMTSGTIPVALDLGVLSVVENSTFTTTTPLNNYAVTANVVRGCTLSQQDIAAAGFSGSGIRPIGDSGRIEGNSLSGGYYVGIRNALSTSFLVISNNRIQIAALTNSTANTSGGFFAAIQTGDGATFVEVLSNAISISGGVFGTYHGITPDLGGTTEQLTIIGNQIFMGNPDLANTSGFGIRLGSASTVTCSENLVVTDGGTDASNQDMTGIHISGCNGAVVSSNTVDLRSIFGTKSWKGIQFGDNSNCTISNNRVSSFGKPVHNGGGVSSSTGMAWLGNEFVSTTAVGAASLIDRIWGRVEGNRFYWNGTGGAQTLSASYGPGIVRGNQSEGATFSYLATEYTIPSLVDSNFSSGVFNVSSSSGSDVNFTFSNNQVVGNSTFTTVRGDIQFIGNNIGGNLSIDGINDRRAVIGSSKVNGTTLLGSSGTTGNYFNISGCSFEGQFTVSNGADVDITGCSFLSASGTSITSNRVQISSCRILNRVTFVFLQFATVEGNIIDGGIDFTGDTGNLRFRITGNRIRTARDIPGIQFVAYSTATGNRIDVVNNMIEVGELTTSGNAVQADGVVFLGAMQEVNIVGNTITFNESLVGDPLGSGTLEYGCVRAAAASNNLHYTFSSNMCSIPVNKNFRTGALLLNYHFLRFGQAQEVGGAGNTLSRNGAWPSNTAPYNGGSFVQYTSATPYNVS